MMIHLTNLTLSSSKQYHTDLKSSKSLHEHDTRVINEGQISPLFLGFPGQIKQQYSQNPKKLTKEMTPDDKSHKQGAPKTQPQTKKKSFMGRRKPVLTRSAVSISFLLFF